MLNIDAIIEDLEKSQELSFEKSFDYAQQCSVLLKNTEEEGRKVIINALNNWSKINEKTKDVWSDLVESSGFYPYLNGILEIKLRNLPAEIRKEIHLSNFLKSKYFHDDQFELLKLLNSDKNVIVSAPTSFGKSLLFEEIIASNKYQNIIIIQPTLALLDETRRKLLKYKNTYKLIVRTSQEPNKERGNIFLFTAERVNEYQLFPPIDFLVIDEFYKLSGNRDDERSSSLNNAFHYILKTFSPKFYLLGPNIDNISEGFSEAYNATFFKSNYSLVDSRHIDIYKNHEGEFGQRGNKAENKEMVLFKLLVDLADEQTIIYCSSPNRVRTLSKKFTNYLISIETKETIHEFPIVEWIENYVSREWSLLYNLKFNIGIHDGALQKHITTSIIDYFNNGKLKYLFCTSTIIEGVNTSAKNIIYFDSKKGLNDIDYFDYSNIKGRAGRMMVHFVGNIYNFNPPPDKEQIVIDIPFFQQDPIKDEILIQLDDDEVKNKETEQYNAIDEIPTEEKEIIKKNGVKVHGQKSIFDILREDIQTKYELINWNQPNYRQLEYILGLAWDNLLVEGETTRPMTKGKLINMTFNYGLNQNIEYLVQSNYSYLRRLTANNNISDSDLMDRAIQDTFQTMKHWFQYKVPKWLSVINEIQRFVCSEFRVRAGNYIFYANLIENDFLRENLAILSEYGIPSSAIRKLEKQIPSDLDQDSVLEFIREKKIYASSNLLEYEKIKLNENITWPNK
ncbi:MAG TPA: helicase [Ignavibacteriales bacterium]|nr:helicase [Ignavibacteriales bacterium]